MDATEFAKWFAGLRVDDPRTLCAVLTLAIVVLWRDRRRIEREHSKDRREYIAFTREVVEKFGAFKASFDAMEKVLDRFLEHERGRE
jgi:hypothetical protein